MRHLLADTFSNLAACGLPLTGEAMASSTYVQDNATCPDCLDGSSDPSDPVLADPEERRAAMIAECDEIAAKLVEQIRLCSEVLNRTTQVRQQLTGQTPQQFLAGLALYATHQRVNLLSKPGPY